MKFNLNTPSMITEAKKSRSTNWNVILVWILVFMIGQVIASIPMGIVMLTDMIKAMVNVSSESVSINGNVQEIMSQVMTTKNVIAMLYITVFPIVVSIIYCTKFEKRSLYSMGLVKKKAVLDYLIGLLVGFVMFTLPVLFCYATGALRLEGLSNTINIGLLIAFFFGFLIQGMSEEIVFRGYLMNSLAIKKSLTYAIVVNSVLFSLFHLGNGGISVLAILNLVLFGVFASVYAMKSDSLWGVCAIHSIWNFVQGNFYGIKVSGIEVSTSVLSSEVNDKLSIINGGDFGLEGGLAVTISLTVAILITLLWKGKSSEKADINNETKTLYEETIAPTQI